MKAFWWKPYASFIDTAVSVRRNGRAWLRLLRAERSLSNFGDAMNEEVLRELTGKPIRWSRPSSADVIAIGSILDIAEDSKFTGAVFGSGVRSSTKSFPRVSQLSILAVRGKLTADRLGVSPSTPMGDPGLLVRDIYGRARGSGRRKPVLVPHFGTYNNSDAIKMVSAFSAQGWDISLPNRSPKEMAEAISSAPAVASSSLHGLIFAHAYGVPAYFVDLEGTSQREPLFKYDDYYSVFELSTERISATDLLDVPVNRLIDNKEAEVEHIAAYMPQIVRDLDQAAKPLRA